MHLNQAQKIALGVGAACVVALSLYVPWAWVSDWKGQHYRAAAGEREVLPGYHWVFTPPTPDDDRIHAEVDWARLCLPLGAVAAATGLAFVLLRRPASLPTTLKEE